MSDPRTDKFLQSKCREILSTNEGTLEHLITEIVSETAMARVEGDTAFDYAKQTIRTQGMKEGLNLLLKKINKYADKPV